MNEVAKSASTAVDAAQERRARVLAKVQALKTGGHAPQAFSGGVQYAKFDGNTGAFTFGKDQNTVPLDQKFIVALDSIEHGMLNWEGGQVKDKLMVKMLDGPAPGMPAGGFAVGSKPAPYDQDGWKDEMCMVMVGYDGGELDGIQLEFSTRASSQAQEIQNLAAACIEQTETPSGQLGFFNPVVKAVAKSFDSKKRKKTYHYPAWEILGWSDGYEVKTLDETPAVEKQAEGEIDEDALLNS